jgi:hypothetical protein
LGLNLAVGVFLALIFVQDRVRERKLARGRHSGRFDWRRHSRYSGNLRDYWTNGERKAGHGWPRGE